MLDNRILVTHSILFKFTATFSRIDERFLIQLENSTEWNPVCGISERAGTILFASVNVALKMKRIGQEFLCLRVKMLLSI